MMSTGQGCFLGFCSFNAKQAQIVSITDWISVPSTIYLHSIEFVMTIPRSRTVVIATQADHLSSSIIHDLLP